MQIRGDVALVTGSNRGIGGAFVEAQMAAGAAKVYEGKVVAMGMSQGLAADRKAVEKHPPKCLPQ